MKNNLIVFVLLFIFYNSAYSNVALPRVISDNMVLQLNTGVMIWGLANPLEEVVMTPSWNNQSCKI